MRDTLVIVIVLAAFLSAPALGQSTVDVGARAPDFDLKDQFGKAWSLTGLSGAVTVLIVADTDSGRTMGPWVDALKTRYPSKVTILGLLDLHSVPWIGRGIAKSRIKKETKDPLMLDFGGGIARAYGVSSKLATVVVIDKTSIIRAVAKQAYDQASFDNIAAAVDKAFK